MPLYLSDPIESSVTFEDLPASRWQGVSAAFEESYNGNPLQKLKISISLANFHNDPILSNEVVKNQIGNLKIKIPENGITQPSLDLLKAREIRHVVLQSRKARTPDGFWQSTLEGTAGAVANLVDPFNVVLIMLFTWITIKNGWLSKSWLQIGHKTKELWLKIGNTVKLGVIGWLIWISVVICSILLIKPYGNRLDGAELVNLLLWFILPPICFIAISLWVRHILRLKKKTESA
jgi:hypothetical protein